MILLREMGSLVFLAIFYVLGICLGNVLPLPLGGMAIAIAIACIGLVLSAFVSGRLVGLTFLFAAFIAGWIRQDRVQSRRHDTLLSAPCIRAVQGIAATPPSKVDDTYRFTVNMTGWSQCLSGPDKRPLILVDGRLYVAFTEDTKEKFSVGDEVLIRAAIKPLIEPRNIGVVTARSDKPVYTAFVTDKSAIAKIRNNAGFFKRFFDAQRIELAAFWDRTLNAEKSALARALILGESSALTQSQKTRFRLTGTAHLLSVSGLHFSIVALIFFVFIKATLARFQYLTSSFDVGRAAAVMTIPATIAFAFLTGLKVPVMRACVMVVSALVARAFSRNPGSVEALAVAAVSLLAIDPDAINNADFQLSFVAVISFLLIFRRREREKLKLTDLIEKKRHFFLKKLLHSTALMFSNVLKSSLAACAVTTPILLYHFNYVSLTGVAANLAAVPWTGFVILPCLLLISLVSRLSLRLAQILCPIIDTIFSAFEGFLGAISKLPYCAVENPSSAAKCAIICLCIGIFCFLLRQKRLGIFGSGVAICLAAFSQLFKAPDFPANMLTIDFLDVGQGDSTLITLPDGSHWLIDAGPKWSERADAGESIVVPVLRANGVNRIDTLVLTHPDLDHVGGLRAVLESMEIGRIFENGQGEADGIDKSYSKLIESAKQRQVHVLRPPVICKTHKVSGVEIQVINPCPKDQSYYKDRSTNDNSIVLSVKHGDVSILLTGDIGNTAEEALHKQDLLGIISVLKLSHHGSKTSTSSGFLDITKPNIAIASLGFFNRYRFPHRAVQQRLKERKTILFRTDLKGGVRILSDGSTVEAQILEANRYRPSAPSSNFSRPFFFTNNRK